MTGTTPKNTGIWSFLALFSSFGTLLCCALPSLLVLFGFGATVAATLTDLPWLVALSRHKNVTFIVAGLLIAGNFVYVYALVPRLKRRGAACDPAEPNTCEPVSRLSRAVLWISALLYMAGAFTAYALGPILMRMDG